MVKNQGGIIQIKVTYSHQPPSKSSS